MGDLLHASFEPRSSSRTALCLGSHHPAQNGTLKLGCHALHGAKGGGGTSTFNGRTQHRNLAESCSQRRLEGDDLAS